MNSQYVMHLKRWFRLLGVYYWHIGDVVLIRLLPFLDGSEHFDQHNAIINSERKAVGSVVYEYLERIKAGEGPGVGPNPIPDQFFALLDPKTGKSTISSRGCPMMRLVITGHLDQGPPGNVPPKQQPTSRPTN